MKNQIISLKINRLVRPLPATLSVFSILILILIIIWIIWKIPEQQARGITDPKDHATVENAVRSTAIQGVGGLFLFITAYFTQRNLVVTQEKQVTERFAKAIEQLGNTSIHVRLGAIYALERISKDSDKDYWQVMEILTAYVRETSPYPPRDKTDNKPLLVTILKPNTIDEKKGIPPITTDIQAILTILTRRTKSFQQGEENPLDLSKAYLGGANLGGANLVGAYLVGAYLKDANLWKANLEEANLWKANLEEANLKDANLMEANLEEANLTGAKLMEANLREAKLWRVKLMKANLREAKLEDANLQKANLGGADLMGAKLGGADLREAKLGGANLGGADLGGANLGGADLGGANLEDANLEKAKLWGASLGAANLEDTNLRDAKLEGAKELTIEQIQKAENWEEAKYSEEFSKELGI